MLHSPSVLSRSILCVYLVIVLPSKTFSDKDIPWTFGGISEYGNRSFALNLEDSIGPIGKFWNSSVLENEDGTNLNDKKPKKYRRFYGKGVVNVYGPVESDDDYLDHHHTRRGYGSFAFAGSGGWNGGGGGYGGKGWNGGYGGKGWGGDNGNNNHYNPGTNKYGGGGPLSFTPGKGIVPHGPGNNGGSSSASSSSSGRGVAPIIPSAPTEISLHIVACDTTDKCHNFVACASHSRRYLATKDRCCLIRQQHNNKGMCCSGHIQGGTSQGNSNGHHFGPYATDKVAVPDIRESSLAAAAMKGYEYKRTYQEVEDRLLELNIVVERNTAAFGHLQFFKVLKPLQW